MNHVINLCTCMINTDTSVYMTFLRQNFTGLGIGNRIDYYYILTGNIQCYYNIFTVITVTLLYGYHFFTVTTLLVNLIRIIGNNKKRNVNLIDLK